MDIRNLWDKALAKTEILRARIKPLSSIHVTKVPYIFLAESSINVGDVIVRKGQIEIEKPALFLPDSLPQFEGFEFAETAIDPKHLEAFFMVRGLRFPSLRYHHDVESLDLFEGSLREASKYYLGQLQRTEDIETGLVLGPDDSWQFSLILLICSQIESSAEADFRAILEEWRRKSKS